jgi:hypothetical protein
MAFAKNVSFADRPVFRHGQPGLQLTPGSLQNKYEVTLVSNRTPEQILGGRVTSSQFMFHDSLQNERDLVINFWEEKCPITEGIAFTIPGPDKTKARFWEAKLDHYGQSIDQRVKFTGWMKEFAKRGGNLVIQEAGPREIDGYSKSHDLVLVVAGPTHTADLATDGGRERDSGSCSQNRKRIQLSAGLLSLVV